MKEHILFALSFVSNLVCAESENTLQRVEVSLSVAERNNSHIEYFNTHYKKNGLYTPKWIDYTGSSRVDYVAGFNAAIKMALYMFPNMGTDTVLKKSITDLNDKPEYYNIGYFAGLEAFSSATNK